METQRTLDRGTGVIVVHPGGGQMRAFEAAAGLLQFYVAGFYFKPDSAWGWWLRFLLRRAGAKKTAWSQDLGAAYASVRAIGDDAKGLLK